MAFQKIAILPSFSLNDPRLHHLDCTTMLLLHFRCYQKYKQTVKFALTEMTLKKPTRTASIQTITLRSKTAGLFLDSSKGLFHICLGGHSAFEGKLSVPRQAQPSWRRCRRLEVSRCIHQSKPLLCPSAARLPEPPAPAASSPLHRLRPLAETRTRLTFNSSPTTKARKTLPGRGEKN